MKTKPAITATVTPTGFTLHLGNGDLHLVTSTKKAQMSNDELRRAIREDAR